MFPLLRTDAERAAWIDRFAADIGALAEDGRAELDAANRQNRFPREVYAELGRRGYLGPLVPQEWGGLGGGAAEYVVINEEIGRHGMVTGQVAIQGQRWRLDWGTDEQKERWLRGIAAGQLVFSESISEKNAGSSFKTMQATATRDGAPLDLTSREAAVLECLLRRKGHVVSKTELLEHCWDVNYDGEQAVVEVLMHRLRRKIERPGRPPAIQTVRGEGYIIRDEA